MRTMANSNELDGVYKLMEQAYQGNWKYRWEGTPYFDTDKNGITEAINEHEYSCCLLWRVLRKHYPALDKEIDSAKVYEILLTHDLGETMLGDVSRYKQLHGAGAGKETSEKEAIKEIVSNINENAADEILNMFEEFEQPAELMTEPETVLAKLIDSLQGDHFCLTFGSNLADNSEVIIKIVYKHTIPYARRLYEILAEKGKAEAAGEVKDIIEQHIKEIRKAGIKIQEVNF